MNYRYKESGVWLTTKEPDHSIADCEFESALMAFAFDDYEALYVIKDLLKAGLRWPSHMIHSFRSIHSLTRDPYIAFYFACVKMGMRDFIAEAKPQWYLRRRYFMAWRKYLIDSDPKQLRIFERNLKLILWWGKNTGWLAEKTSASKIKIIKQLRHRFGIHSYSLLLWCLMAHAAESKKAEYAIEGYLPGWNLFNRLLLDVASVSEDEIFDYVPQKGFQWSGWKLRTDRPLDSDDQHPLDKQLLKKLAFG